MQYFIFLEIELYLLEDILILELLLIHQISSVVHASGVRKKRHGLRKTEDQTSNVRLFLGLNMGTMQLLNVALHKRFFSTQSSHCANIRNGFNGKLKKQN